MMETDPDWAPSLHMGHASVKPTNTARFARQNRREQLRKTLKMGVKQADIIEVQIKEEPPEPDEESGLKEEEEEEEASDAGCESAQLQTREERHEAAQGHDQQIAAAETNNSSQTVMQTECYMCVLRRAEIYRLLEENRELRRELEERRISEGFFREDDEKVKYYTGFPNLVTFMTLFQFLLPLIPSQKKILTPFQMLLLTFMRLRLDLPVQHLVYLFRVSPNTAYRTFNDMVSFLYANLKSSIKWPNRDNLDKCMPHQFVEAFGNRIAVIIDILEIVTEKPSNLETRAQMFSSSRHNHTMKYLIGITPKGAICFVSKCSGGRTSDKDLILNSGFVDQLLPGDIVLADRGFDVQEGAGMLCAEVKPPAVPDAPCQLAARSMEETKKIAHLRIHLKKVLGNVCQKFKILTGTIPVNMIVQREAEEAIMLDKVVAVCCALTNHCPRVVRNTEDKQT